MKRSTHVVMLAMMLAMLAMLAALEVPAYAAPSSSMARYKPTSPRALAHFEAGNRLYKSGVKPDRPFAERVRDLKLAIEAYLAGRAIEDAPAFDYNLGHASWVLVDNVSAVTHLLRFLERAAPDEQLRAAVETEIATLDPSGAIRADLRRARDAVRSAEPKEATAPAVPAPNDPPRAPASPALTPAGQPIPTTSARADASHGWAWLGWSLTAAGVVGGGVTTWLAVSAASLRDDAQDVSRPTSERLDLEDRSDSRRRTAFIVGVGSGAAIVLGIVTLALPARDAAPRRTSAWNVGLTGHGVAVFGRF